jgi:hypothetical protein
MDNADGNGKIEWEFERDRLFEEQERDMAEADAKGQPIWPQRFLNEAELIQWLFEEFQERNGVDNG